MIKDKNSLLGKRLFFIAVVFLSSRLLICIALLAIAPALPAQANGLTAKFGWDAFYAWDSVWYHRIVVVGYEFVNDGKQYSVAFFPLFPLLSKILTDLGLPFKVAGTLLNNVAFFGALTILYVWVEENHSRAAARWATAVLAWCPLSLYGSVIYTEGLFLLFSTLALRAFEKRQHLWAGVWGALSTATRSPGLALIPAFLFVSWKERRGIKAYFATLGVGLGVALFSLYCLWQFGDPLAFVHVQKGWRSSTGFAWEGWWYICMQIIFGSTNVQSGYLQDPWHPIIFTSILVSGLLIWRFRQKLNSLKIGLIFFILCFLLWRITGDPSIQITIVFGGIYLLWHLRAKMPLVATIYALFSYALILNTGLTASVERYAYGIVSLSYASGLLLARYPRLGVALMSLFAIILANFAIRFAQHQWVA